MVLMYLHLLSNLCFRLTIRNVNVVVWGKSAENVARFRLTIRNVNWIKMGY